MLFAVVSQQEPGLKNKEARQGHIVSNSLNETNKQRNHKRAQDSDDLPALMIRIKQWQKELIIDTYEHIPK